MRPLVRIALPALALAVAVARPALARGFISALLWLAMRLLQILVLIVVSGGVWWALRSLQLQREQELLDQALLRFRYYSRYRHRSSSGKSSATAPTSGSSFGSAEGVFSSLALSDGVVDAGFQLRVLKRLPVSAHLRTSWGLPPPLCDEIALLVRLISRDYVLYWFAPISPNDDFPHDVQFLLADLLGAAVSRLLEVDSSQALTMVSKGIELLRMHLGWFREAYAQLADQHPDVFDGDESDANLAKRQELVADFVQRSSFIHPGCVANDAGSGDAGTAKKSDRPPDGPEAQYLRHLASQLLAQLKPQLGQQHDSNLFVSIVMNLLREITAFKILQPLTEFALPRYANELVVACLGSFVDDKDMLAQLPTSTASSSGLPSSVGRQSLASLRLTKSFLYKASRRSTEQAEAAFQALVDAVASAATTATSGAAEVFDNDEWSEAAAFTFGNPVLNALSGSSNSGAGGDRKPIVSRFSLDERLSITKASKLMDPRNFMSQKSGDGGARTNSHLDDLKNVKANIGSSINTSFGKVKKRFRTLSAHPNDPLAAAQSLSITGTKAATRMMRKPGQLLQKAWKRGESGAPTSPNAVSFEDLMTPPSTPDGDDGSHGINGTLSGDLLADDESPGSPGGGCDGDSERPSSPGVDEDHEETDEGSSVQDRIVLLVDKAVGNFVKMYHERPEMRGSSRSRELYELLSALEDVLMLGYRYSSGSNAESSQMNGVGEPNTTVEMTEDDLLQSSLTRRMSRRFDGGDDNGQYYWNYLAQDWPSTPSLNDHWRFVDTRCPPCCESDSFVSTRGIQWILVALEKGSLCELFTGLRLRSELTRQFYDEHAVLSDPSSLDGVLASLFMLNKLKLSLEIPTLLGRKSEMDEEFGVSSGRSAASPTAGVVRVLESVCETERYMPMHGWVKAQDKRRQELPSSEWVWEGEWTVETRPADPVSPGDSSDSERGSFGANSADSGSWEYAKTFDDRFHSKERKFDAVRRRRWVRRRRQLPPVLVAMPLPSSPVSGNGATSPGASSSSMVAAANAVSKARKLQQRFDVLKRGTGKVGRTIVKRRSFSMDKSSPASPLSIPSLAALNVELDSPSTAAGAASSPSNGVKKKRASIPSFRRSISGRSDQKEQTGGRSSLGASRELRNSVLSSGYEDDLDDDDDLCFRCLKSLAGPDQQRSADICQGCHQRVCASCHDFFAFLVFPPPLESTRKARVCGTCYDRLTSKYRLRIDAHVGKYLIRERERDLPDLFGTSSGEGGGADDGSTDGAGPVSPTAAGNNARYEITVRVKDEGAYAWTAVKTFHDFEVLEKALFEKLKQQEKKHGVGCRQCHLKGVDYMELQAVEPSLRQLPVAALAYDKRLYVLEEFLQSLLASDTLCQSSTVQKFLLLGNSAAGGVGCASTASSQPTADAGESSVGGGAAGSGSGPLSSPPLTASSCGMVGPSQGAGLLMENGKWKKGRWVAPDANSKETKMRVLQKLEVSLFAALSEAFEFDGIGLVRRHLFTMTRSFIKAFLSASHFRALERQVLSLTEPRKLAASLLQLRVYLFPDPPERGASPPPPPPPATLPPAEMQALRAKCLEALLASFPSKLEALVGETACETAALKLHEFLQHEVFVKNLLFSLTDELLLHLFPDATVYKFRRAPAPPLSNASSSSAPPSPTRAAAVSVGRSPAVTAKPAPSTP